MGQPIISLNANRSVEIRAAHEKGGGVVGFISWNRLVEIFRQTGEVEPTETVESIVLEDNGMHIYYRDRTHG